MCSSVERLSSVLARRVVSCALEQGLTIATAESLTGGCIASALTSVSGSSAVFPGSIVSYSNEIKAALLGVEEDVLRSSGAVSAPVARQMAVGACRALSADYAVSVTGIAGPTGATPGKPIGTVWIGVANAQGASRARRFQFEGTREVVRERTVETALDLLLSSLESHS